MSKWGREEGRWAGGELLLSDTVFGMGARNTGRGPPRRDIEGRKRQHLAPGVNVGVGGEKEEDRRGWRKSGQSL